MEIKRVFIRNVDVPDIPVWAVNIPDSLPLIPPVTVNIGFPIIDMPGCVEAREQSGNDNLYLDDPNGTLVLCDAPVPTLRTPQVNPNNLPPEIEPEKIVNLPDASVANLGDQKEESEETDESKAENTQQNFTKPELPSGDLNLNLPKNIDVKQESCPRPDDPPVGSKGKFGTKRVESYFRNEEGECVTNWVAEKPQDVAFTYLPPPPLVLTTGATAAVAVTSSVLIKPLSDYLLKVVKPLVKKVLKKSLPKLLKKKPKVLSVRERQVEQRNLRK